LRAEQSRAEQSRAEQSRAEQSRATTDVGKQIYDIVCEWSGMTFDQQFFYRARMANNANETYLERDMLMPPQGIPSQGRYNDYGRSCFYFTDMFDGAINEVAGHQSKEDGYVYKTYGYCLNNLHSYEFDGSAGFAKMQSIMQAFCGDIRKFGGKKVIKLLDYAQGLDGLPKSDVLKLLLEDNCSIVVRPSGTEPKLKTYISVSAENKEAAEKIEAEICKSAEEYLK